MPATRARTRTRTWTATIPAIARLGRKQDHSRCWRWRTERRCTGIRWWLCGCDDDDDPPPMAVMVHESATTTARPSLCVGRHGAILGRLPRPPSRRRRRKHGTGRRWKSIQTGTSPPPPQGWSSLPQRLCGAGPFPLRRPARSKNAAVTESGSITTLLCCLFQSLLLQLDQASK